MAKCGRQRARKADIEARANLADANLAFGASHSLTPRQRWRLPCARANPADANLAGRQPRWDANLADANDGWRLLRR